MALNDLAYLHATRAQYRKAKKCYRYLLILSYPKSMNIFFEKDPFGHCCTRRSLAILQSSYGGTNHPEVAFCLSSLAWVYYKVSFCTSFSKHNPCIETFCFFFWGGGLKARQV